MAFGRALFKTDSAALRHPAACDSVSEKRGSFGMDQDRFGRGYIRY